MVNYISDVPFKQSSPVAVAGAVIGAVLALFIITIFVTVLLTPRKKRSSYLDKMIDLPPTHKPPSSYEERARSLSRKEIIIPKQHFSLQKCKENECRDKEGRNLQPKKMVNCRQFSYEDENHLPQDHQKMYVFKQTNCKDWSNKNLPNPGNGRVYINPREHYV